VKLNLFYNENDEINRIFQEDSMRRAFSFLIGAVMGGLVGATAALLFAPSSGLELRSQIEARTRGFTADIRQAAGAKRIELQERLETLRAPRS
jgi:gas vesicle protein